MGLATGVYVGEVNRWLDRIFRAVERPCGDSLKTKENVARVSGRRGRCLVNICSGRGEVTVEGIVMLRERAME